VWRKQRIIVTMCEMLEGLLYLHEFTVLEMQRYYIHCTDCTFIDGAVKRACSHGGGSRFGLSCEQIPHNLFSFDITSIFTARIQSPVREYTATNNTTELNTLSCTQNLHNILIY